MVQLIQDYEDYDEVNKQLEKMGYNIGTRLIEDFLARSNIGRCADFRETGEVVAKVRFVRYVRRSVSLTQYVCVCCCKGRVQVVLEYKSYSHPRRTDFRGDLADRHRSPVFICWSIVYSYVR